MGTRGSFRMAALLGLTLALGLTPEAARACWTPLEWQGAKPVPWSRDADGNSLEDSLDEAIRQDPSRSVSVVLDLSRCPDAAAMAQLASYGTVLKRGRFLTFVAMEVEARRLPELASLPLVARIEEMHGFAPLLDVSVAAIKVRASPDYSPLTLEDALPDLRGLGLTLAVIDSGVDDQDGPGVTHRMFPPGKFVGGYIAPLRLPGNPDDVQADATNVVDVGGHGTHVAGIAVGAQVGGFRGVAPDAGLVDCRVNMEVCGPPAWLDVMECLEQILLNDTAWGVDVVNMSFKYCVPTKTITTDGTDAISKMANHLVARGIHVVASGGNDGPDNSGLSSPCAADGAICVAAMDDKNTVSRGNDVVWHLSSRGPRADDGDQDSLDELKPEVSAPGANVLSAEADTVDGFKALWGTSMASPHVAGAAILVAEARPGIHPGSLKHLLIHTSEDRGPAGWDPASGHGYVDIHRAVTAPAAADPGYPGAGTYPRPWLCSDLTTQSPPVAGVPNTLIATVRNDASTPAEDVQVTFGVYVYAAGTPEFYSVGARTVELPAHAQVQVTHPWTPPPFLSGKASLRSTIDYGFDADFSDNVCLRSVAIGPPGSAAGFRFQVQNSLTEAATVRLAPSPLPRFPGELPGEAAYRLLPGERMWVPARWTPAVTEDELRMEPGDCPADVTLTLDLAASARPVDGALYEVPALAAVAGGREIGMGGVTAYAHSPCPAGWGGDADGDAVCDVFDVCAGAVNPEQMDADSDGLGDVCDARPYAADAPANDARCRQRILSGELSGSRAYDCLEEFKTTLSLFAGRSPRPAQQIVDGRIDAAQTDLCRAAEARAAARLEALQHHVALLQEAGGLATAEASTYSAKAGECRDLVLAAVAAKARPFSSFFSAPSR